jgi:APA family basic amino acid/polyamine antiporter
MLRTGSVEARERLLQQPAMPQSTSTLRRVLGVWDLTSLGVGATIGGGIFVITGLAAAQYAGPAVVLSFILAGLAASLIALIYAELAVHIPVAGPTYVQVTRTLGAFPGWVIGWTMFLLAFVGGGILAGGWSAYLLAWLHGFGVTVPAWASAPPGVTPEATINLPAVAIIWVLTVIAASGIRPSVLLTHLFVILKISVLLLFVGVGLIGGLSPAHWTPWLPFGWRGVLTGAGFVFYAYMGFEVIAGAVEEAHNPWRDVPLGIVGSFSFCALLYLAVSGVLTGLLPSAQLGVPAPLVHALEANGHRWASGIIAFGALCALASVLLVSIVAYARVFFAMGRDRLLPQVFAIIHPRWGTPIVATLVPGILMSVAAAFFPVRPLAELATLGRLLGYVLMCCGLIVLRVRKPPLPVRVRGTGTLFTPLLGIGLCLLLGLGLSMQTWVGLGIWVGVGGVIYGLALGRRVPYSLTSS